jgi:tryptophan-rich sensory protein
MGKNTKNLILFLVLNFAALGIGSFLMGSSPVENSWYQSLNLAPWTPPGWVFGAAWTTIMTLFSIYMMLVFREYPTKQNRIIYLFADIVVMPFQNFSNKVAQYDYISYW